MSAHRQDAVRRLAAPDIAARKGKTPIVCSVFMMVAHIFCAIGRLSR